MLSRPRMLFAAAVVALLAVLVCTLIAGTPVNNDPSPAASRAGIHLTALHAPPRAVAPEQVPGFALLSVWILLLASASDSFALGRLRRRTWAPGTLELPTSCPRRGPPVGARARRPLA